jgi:peptide/nickel transport system substrate-binding protein
METLVWYDNNTLTLKPMLATEVPSMANGLISADGKTYTFNLRPNVKFHNNETMTAADVIYSIKRVLMINDPDGPAWILGEILIPDYYNYDGRTNASWLGPGQKWPGYIPEANCSKAFYAVDSDTVQFNLTTPVPYFLYCMAFTVACITSQKYVEDNGGDTPGEQNAWMNRHICGTGPYMLKSWDANQQVVMERWDGYWRTPASIQYVIIKKATDYGTRLMMLQAGDADGIDFPRIQRSDIEGNDKIVINTDLPTFNMDFLGLNQNINMSNNPAKSTDTITSDFFADINVRRAFASAFDYDTAIETYFAGTAIQPRSIIPKGMFGYSDAVPLYEYNLTAAANYLNNAPSDTPGESWGEKGFTITLMYNSGNVWRELECMVLAEGLSKLSSQGLVNGTIKATALGLDWPTYLATNRGNGLPAFFLGWAPDYADPNNYVGPFLHSSGTYAKRCSIFNATITDWINVAAVNLTDSVRADLYYNISMGCYDNCYYILTAQATNFDVLQSYVQGYYFNPMYSNFYYYAFSK